MTLLVVPAWLVVGVLVGLPIRWGSVRLARLEEPELLSGPRGRSTVRRSCAGCCSARLCLANRAEPDALSCAACGSRCWCRSSSFDFRAPLDPGPRPASRPTAAALALSLVTPHLGWKMALLTGLGAGLLFLAIAVIGYWIFKAEALGFGDVKMAVFIGLVLEPGPPSTRSSRASCWPAWWRSTSGVPSGKSPQPLRVRPFLAAGTLIELSPAGGQLEPQTTRGPAESPTEPYFPAEPLESARHGEGSAAR